MGYRKLHRDEYYDTRGRVLDSQDFVVRVRRVDERIEIGMKGARFRTPAGDYSRVEVEFTPRSADELGEEIQRQSLECTWYLEKRRQAFHWNGIAAEVVVDEVPLIGHFVEIEGTSESIREIALLLAPALGEKVAQNYRELVVAHCAGLGDDGDSLDGVAFD